MSSKIQFLMSCYMTHLVHELKVKASEVVQLCPTLCDPMDCNRPGCSVHGILQARILEWVAVPFSRGSSWPSEACFTAEPPGKPEDLLKYRLLVPTSAFPIQLVIWYQTWEFVFLASFLGNCWCCLSDNHTENTEFEKTIYNEKQSYSGEVIID